MQVKGQVKSLDQWKRAGVIHHGFLKARLVSGGAFLALAGLFLILAANNTFSLSSAFPRQWVLLSRWIGGAFTTIGVFTFHFGIMKQYREKKPKNLAEFSLSYDPTTRISTPIKKSICVFLDTQSFVNMMGVNKEWNACSNEEDLWKRRVDKICSNTIARLLFQSRKSWKRVFHDLKAPIHAKSTQLRSDPIYEKGLPVFEASSEIQEATELVNGNVEGLKKFIVHLKQIGKSSFLHHRVFGLHSQWTYLELMADRGSEEGVKVLIDFGCTLAILGVSSRQENALFLAATNGRSNIVQLLLDHGALVDVRHAFFNSYGRYHHFFISLVEQVGIHFSDRASKNLRARVSGGLLSQKDNSDIQLSRQGKKLKLMDCFILLVNAWKAQNGSKNVKNHCDAKAALTQAVIRGYFDLADLLIALGITLQASKKEIFESLINAIREDDRDGVQWIHTRFKTDFNTLSYIGTTLLHAAAQYHATEVLNYLLTTFNIPQDAKDADGKTYKEYIQT